MLNSEKLHSIREELRNCLGNHAFTAALFIIFDTLEDVGDGNISYSEDNLGFNITKDAIDIVDIDTGEVLVTLTITI